MMILLFYRHLFLFPTTIRPTQAFLSLTIYRRGRQKKNNMVMFGIVFCILTYPNTVSGATNASCFDKCVCCKDEKCTAGVHGWPNVCTQGCIDGHRGARCYELCQYKNCKSCGAGSSSRECGACYDGYYLGVNKDCTSSCPSNCKTCTSFTSCTECKDGFFNADGSNTCESALCLGNCVCTPGQNDCPYCQVGYYNISNSCKSKCPDKCDSCVSKSECISCKTGFYNGYKNDFSREPPITNCSLTCRETCTRCHSYNNCSQCLKGKFGLSCQYNCSVGCSISSCMIESGNCNCSTNFTGANCTECKDGKHGHFCNLTCPKDCKANKCDRSSGHCIIGCKTNTIIGDLCSKCESGMYGELCGKTCPKNCLNSICGRYNGSCLACEETFNGTYCEICVRGKHGQACNENCPEKCSGKICKKDTGHCLTCVENYVGSRCDTCTSGKYGPKCDDKCSLHCDNDTCDRYTSVCVYGCKEDYSGDKCCVENGNCINCSSSTACSKCKTGFYLQTCTKRCPDKCLGSCNIETGACITCKINYFGQFCNLSCSENCSSSNDKEKNRCEQVDGTCINGCVTGQYGPTCNESCSWSCINNTCLQDNGECKHGCVEGNVGLRCLQSSGQTSELDNLTGPVVGGVSALVIVVALGIVAAILFRRRQMTKDTSDLIRTNDKRTSVRQGETAAAAKEGPVYANIPEKGQIGLRADIESEDVGVQDIKIDEQNNENQDDNYYNCNKTHLSVNVSNLFSYVTGRKAVLFEKEFKNLPKPDDLSKVCRIAKKPENIALNRYNGIYPFDHSRVTIPSQPKFFINACYIDGYNREKAYIASFGPTAKTTDHFKNFWRMVWHEKSDVIVMLTNLHEESGMKCEQYWPDADTEVLYDQVKVKYRSVEEFAEYTVRIFTVSKGKEHRNLTQLHFTAWPDKGVPSEVTSLVEFRQRVKAVPVVLDGPIIVHCSAGVGRTGTYIALDILTEQGQAEDSVDVFGCVSKMRGQRVTMVQTAEQYKFLYKALVHSLTFECEAVPAERLQSLVFEADDVFTRMFRTLKKEIDTETEENVVAREENTRRFPDKSRRHSDIPGNRARVRLYLSRKSGDYDFINAVFISSFKTRNLFIAAQTPLPSTVEDFLCMIYQQSASCVVALESPESSSRRSDVGKYLPADNESYRCGDFTVTSTKFENKSQYVLKKLSIQNDKKGDSKTVYHFQYTKWRNEHKVADSAADFVHFVKEVEKYIGESDTPHIVVHCLNGYERSGLFCVVYKLLEKLEAERQVSVVNIVRKIRTQRKFAVTSVEQLKFCYQCISAYLESYNTYSNFAV